MSTLTRYLLDTNVISETRRPRMDKCVEGFLNQVDANNLFLSVLTLGELRKGVVSKRRTDPATGDALSAWVDELEEKFADRIVNIDVSVAKLWGEISSDRSRPVIDTLIGATAIANGMVLGVLGISAQKVTISKHLKSLNKLELHSHNALNLLGIQVF